MIIFEATKENNFNAQIKAKAGRGCNWVHFVHRTQCTFALNLNLRT